MASRSSCLVAEHLAALRNAGGDSQLRLALAKIWGESPLGELTAVMSIIQSQTVTQSTWRSHFADWNLRAVFFASSRLRGERFGCLKLSSLASTGAGGAILTRLQRT